MNEVRIVGLLGLGYRGKRLAMGEDSLKALATKKGALILVAKDASDNTKKRAKDKGNFYDVPVLEFANKRALGLSLGKRAVAIITIFDYKLALSLLDNMKAGDVDGKI